MKHIHILGICGTFMGSLAVLAKAQGFRVTGSDLGVYPPMSTHLVGQGIDIYHGYSVQTIKDLAPDQIIVGNALSRGNPVVEWLLTEQADLVSGPQWLYEHVLKDKHVLAVAGTHGKTTTASMLAWILHYACLEPGFLIGGIAKNFHTSARMTAGRYFVIEADEYDTAFFDKRSKFIHYRPQTLVLNNLEFDHADIFRDLADITRQFQHLLKIIPPTGNVMVNSSDANLSSLVSAGSWSKLSRFGLPDADWSVQLKTADASRFAINHLGKTQGQVSWQLAGEFNALNALAAVAGAYSIGVEPQVAIDALNNFAGVKRRLEIRGQVAGVTIYDDFAHHPTAIAHTLTAVCNRVNGQGRVIAVVEPRSNTMKMGVWTTQLAQALAQADCVFLLKAQKQNWDLAEHWPIGNRLQQFNQLECLLAALLDEIKPNDAVIIMSNGSFGNIHEILLTKLEQLHNHCT